LKYGIKASNAVVKYYNGILFKEIDDWNNPTNPDGAAIWIENNSDFSRAANYNAPTNIISIYGARRGIYINKSNAMVDKAIIGTNSTTAKPTNTGVEIRQCTDLQKVTVISSTITATDMGIFAWQNNHANISIGERYPVGTYAISPNNIRINASLTASPVAASGIYIAESGLVPNHYTIANNTILMNFGYAGLQVSNTLGNDVVIKKNHITLTPVTGEWLGLRARLWRVCQ
jgi:hypothetical protein